MKFHQSKGDQPDIIIIIITIIITTIITTTTIIIITTIITTIPVTVQRHQNNCMPLP